MQRLITAVKNSNNEKGQSLVEFLFFFPVMIGVGYTTYLVNSAIQTSIVNQKYARAQALFLTHNSPVYPHRGIQNGLVAAESNIMIIGISQNLVPDDGGVTPEASIQKIVRPGVTDVGVDDEQTEPLSRGVLRIRTTVALCTQNNFVLNDTERKPIDSTSMNENVAFDYCRSHHE